MLIERSNIKLMSLLLVFLTENFETSTNRCNVCDTTTPGFSKSFFVSGKWICVNCIVRRIRADSC